MATVLILDHDLGFVFWLGQALAAGDFQSVPARNVAEAKRLLRTLALEADVLIVNPTLPGVEAYIKTLLRRQRKPRIMAAVGSFGDEDVVPFQVEAIRRKPLIQDELAMSEWRLAVARVLSGESGSHGGRAIA